MVVTEVSYSFDKQHNGVLNITGEPEYADQKNTRPLNLRVKPGAIQLS